MYKAVLIKIVFEFTRFFKLQNVVKSIQARGGLEYVWEAD